MVTIPKHVMVPIEKLKPHPKNIKHHPRDQIQDLMKLIELEGFKDPLVLDKNFTIFAGHGRLEAAKKLKMSEVPCIFLQDLDEKTKAWILLADNRINDSPWIKENVSLVLEDIGSMNFPEFNMNFEDFYLTSTLDTQTEQDETPEEYVSRCQSGDLWELGEHRLLVGDCTLIENKKKLFGTLDEIDVIVTDPPYSSGGFQEASKHVGSIGTRRIDEKTGKEYTPTIKMDDLSTRGYTKLIRQALADLFAHNVYLFTDWRMWDWTRESIETSGYQVRGMIVWDKLTPGMGIQWRGQHELVCFGRAKETVTPAWFRGNVINAKRSGNKHHPTEKPIEVLTELIKTNLRNATVYDPFAGSGSTLITAEQLGKKCFCMEMDLEFSNIILQRWENLTKKEAKLISRINSKGDEVIS